MPMLKKLLIFPFGGTARETLLIIEDINRHRKTWDVLGFIDDDPKSWGQGLNGVKVLGGRDKLKKFPSAQIIAVPSDPKSYLKKKSIVDLLDLDPSRFATIIHPSAVVSADSRIGYNTVIMPHTFISCGVTVGNHVAILPNTVISHDSSIGDYCFIGAHVAISGTVHIKSQSFIASGSTIRDHINIGEKSFIGLGSNVVKDVQKNVVIAGNPARILSRKMK